MTLPEDPMMLFSFINMKLRDNYSSLDELCDDMHLQKEMLVQKLKSAGSSIVKRITSFGNRWKEMTSI